MKLKQIANQFLALIQSSSRMFPLIVWPSGESPGPPGTIQGPSRPSRNPPDTGQQTQENTVKPPDMSSEF